MVGFRAAIVVSAVLALLPCGAAHAQSAATPLAPAVVLDRHSLVDPQFSPAGDRVAFTVTAPPKGDLRNSDVWVYDLRTRQARAFATSPKSDASPRWSPDGETIAFLSDRDGARQVYLISALGGEARALTEQKAGVQAFEWSPDGRRIAFTGSEPRSDDEEQRIKNKDDERVADLNDRPCASG